jgi:hypothetical protein
MGRSASAPYRNRTTRGCHRAADDRARLRDELTTRLIHLEHLEEALVTAALAAGIEVHRRYDASEWAPDRRV